MNRERITISIREDILKAIDKRIDGVRLRNRSHAIETLVSDSLGLDSMSDAIILAGGDNPEKSIPAVRDALLRLKRIGLNDVIIAIGYKGDKIKSDLGDGKEFGLKLTYLDKGEGTGGAILPLKSAIKKTFMVINLKNKLDLDYKMLADFHKAGNSIATIATNDIKTFEGVYLLEPEIYSYLPKGFSMLEEDIFPKILKEGKLSIYPVIS
jgi:NDP-sugar pyrophosphorylase family protein